MVINNGITADATTINSSWKRFMLFAVAFPLGRSIARGAGEHTLASDGRVAGAHVVAAILCPIAFHRHLLPDRKTAFSPSATDQAVRWSGLAAPSGDFAIGFFYVKLNPGVRIDPVHFGKG